MNEKIKQLAELAGITFTDYGTGEFLTEDDISLPRLEKFAELIVAECIDVFSKDLPNPTRPDYQLGSLPEVINRVANVVEHFRVEDGREESEEIIRHQQAEIEKWKLEYENLFVSYNNLLRKAQ